MKLALIPLIALCAACASVVPTDPTTPAPEPASPREAPAAPMAPDSAGALQERLMNEPNFAGLYMHPPGSDRAIVLFTGADAAAQLARYTTDRRFTARSARYSYARLRQTQDTLNQAFQRERIHFMTSSTDVINNRVEVDVVNEADTRALARERGVTIPEEVAFNSRGGVIAEAQTLPPEVTAFPQARYPAGIELTALARGRLTIENGCIRLGEGADSTLILWPSHAELRRVGNRIVVRESRSGESVAVGDLIEMGGGQSPSIDGAFLTAPVPSACRGPYFAAASGWHVDRDPERHDR